MFSLSVSTRVDRILELRKSGTVLTLVVLGHESSMPRSQLLLLQRESNTVKTLISRKTKIVNQAEYSSTTSVHKTLKIILCECIPVRKKALAHQYFLNTSSSYK